jgi:DNA-binding response OmpR family regulator
VVDDDPSIAETLAFRLDRVGYRTMTARRGRDAIEMAQSLLPQLVLLDLGLPDVDGFSVCEALDGDVRTCQIPIIILSGMEKPDIVRRARAAGCAYYVRKPYDPNTLLVLIQYALGEVGEL